MEAALKLARQYFVEIGQLQHTTFVARRQSYHGNTLGALAVGGNEWRRSQFAPLLMDVGRAAPCYPCRDLKARESEAAYTQRLLAEIEAQFLAIGTDRVIAFVAETVVPDLMTIAKGLGGGYQPIGAVLAAAKVINPIRSGSGLFQHGHTYIGHPMACAAALAVQQVIQRSW